MQPALSIHKRLFYYNSSITCFTSASCGYMTSLNKSRQRFLARRYIPHTTLTNAKGKLCIRPQVAIIIFLQNAFSAVTAFCRSPSSAYCCASVYCVNSTIYSGYLFYHPSSMARCSKSSSQHRGSPWRRQGAHVFYWFSVACSMLLDIPTPYITIL